MDKLTEFVQDHKAKGLAYFPVTAEGLEGPIAKFFGGECAAKEQEKSGRMPKEGSRVRASFRWGQEYADQDSYH